MGVRLGGSPLRSCAKLTVLTAGCYHAWRVNPSHRKPEQHPVHLTLSVQFADADWNGWVTYCERAQRGLLIKRCVNNTTWIYQETWQWMHLLTLRLKNWLPKQGTAAYGKNWLHPFNDQWSTNMNDEWWDLFNFWMYDPNICSENETKQFFEGKNRKITLG